MNAPKNRAIVAACGTGRDSVTVAVLAGCVASRYAHAGSTSPAANALRFA
jgi:hypothetical protein